MSDEIKIQQGIVQRVGQETFSKISYAADGMASLGGKAVPSVTVEPLRSTWEDSKDKTVVGKLDRGLWVFQLILEFKACRASVEQFENSLADSPLTIRLTSGTLARVRLSESDYSHPPRQQPQGGTRAVYTLEVTTT